MEPREVYRQVRPVQRIVDAYASTVPWGGLSIADGDARHEVAADWPRLVRELMIEGRAECDVRSKGESKAVSFEYRDMMPGPFPVVRLVASVASSFAKFEPRAGDANVSQYLEMLLQDMGLGLSLPLWILSPQVRTANAQALKWALMSFLAQCERYRNAIVHGVKDAFGTRPKWNVGLRPEGPWPTEYSAIYQAFCAQGIELTPLRDESRLLRTMLLPLGVVTAEEVDRIEAAFPACGT